MNSVNDEKFLNSNNPILFMLFGISIFFNEIHPEQNKSSIFSTDDGMINSENFSQNEKAFLPIDVTDSGIVI